MRDDCVNELAELYALGELDELERARIERHASTCDVCARRLGEAEEAVLRMIESEPLPERPAALDRRMRFGAPSATPAWLVAVAAAFALGFVPWTLATLHQTAAETSDARARAAMLAGHFVHAPFAALAPGAPDAKVVYAREGGWLYVIVASGPDALDVAVERGGSRTTVASIGPGQTVRSAFVAEPGRVDRVVLLKNGSPIALARVVYPASPR